MGTMTVAGVMKAFECKYGAGMKIFDRVSLRNGVFTGRRSYFYKNGLSSDLFADKVADAGFEVIEHGDHWAAFKGGADLAKQSHFWVKFKVKE